MNTQNSEFLEKSLLNLGFGEQLNEELRNQISKKSPEFTLAAQNEYNGRKVDYNLHFKSGDHNEMYFFNKYEASIKDQQGNANKQSFYINKGNGVTAKEAFNLMEGRAVHKQLFNQAGEKYTAWLKLDDHNLTEGGNKKFQTYNEKYGYHPEEILTGKGIKEMKTDEGRENLLRSLKKGNAQQITVERDGKEQKYYITANPQFKTVDLYDLQMKKVKREELLVPAIKASNVQDRKQHQETVQEKKPARNNKIKL